ncbi:hypothetical protein [Hydrogenophaga sp.]|uniref:hypothetical protein n=1 Tax=Hydrogenophaga sp. TaxID=1904254 RepID=UPI00273329A4|nr:hypothetical protein [Hydrogenophaga sp.]
MSSIAGRTGCTLTSSSAWPSVTSKKNFRPLSVELMVGGGPRLILLGKLWSMALPLENLWLAPQTHRKEPHLPPATENRAESKRCVKAHVVNASSVAQVRHPALNIRLPMF